MYFNTKPESPQGTHKKLYTLFYKNGTAVLIRILGGGACFLPTFFGRILKLGVASNKMATARNSTATFGHYNGRMFIWKRSTDF